MGRHYGSKHPEVSCGRAARVCASRRLRLFVRACVCILSAPFKSESLGAHALLSFQKVLPKLRGAWPPRELGAAIAAPKADGRRAKEKPSWQSARFLFVCLSAPQLKQPCGAVGPPYPCPQQPRFSGQQEAQRKMSGPAWCCEMARAQQPIARRCFLRATEKYARQLRKGSGNRPPIEREVLD